MSVRCVRRLREERGYHGVGVAAADEAVLLGNSFWVHVLVAQEDRPGPGGVAWHAGGPHLSPPAETLAGFTA